MRAEEDFFEGYFSEESRLLPAKPPPGSAWNNQVGSTYAKNGKENGQFWRVSCNGILQVKQVWKKLTRHKNAELSHVGWEVVDLRPTAFKSFPLCETLWSYLTPLKNESFAYRNCDKCGKLLREFEGGDLIIPRTGIEIQPPQEVRTLVAALGGIVTSTGIKKSYHICLDCCPEEWHWCKRCETYHKKLEVQPAIAHLSAWLTGLQGVSLPTGAHVVAGRGVMHPGDQLDGLVGAISDALVCWPRKEEAVSNLKLNIERLTAIMLWHTDFIKKREQSDEN